MNSYKVALLICIVAALNLSVMAQRGSYAGSRPGSGYKDRFRPRMNETEAEQSDIANRFDNNNPDATQRPPSQDMPVVMGEPVLVNNRISENAEPSSTLTPSRTAETSSKLPFDAHGDEELVKYLLSLPEDKRPFWFLNYQAIEAHRNSTSNGGNINTLASRSSFLGK